MIRDVEHIYGVPFNPYQLQVTLSIQAIHSRITWTSGNHLALQQLISNRNSLMMIRLSISRVCLDYAWYATRLQYETNTLFSSCLTLFFFAFWIYFLWAQPKENVSVQKCKCLLTGDTLFFGVSLISSIYELMRLALWPVDLPL
jgi:hypothetical protein